MRLTTGKEVKELALEVNGGGGGGDDRALAAEVLRKVEAVERAYQEELNRGFAALSEGSFKGLRRQLPVTRQKVEWDKVGGYRVSFVFLTLWFFLDSLPFWCVEDALGKKGMWLADFFFGMV